MANTKFKVILEMPFLKFNNANMSFDKRILMQKSYTTNKALSITKQIQIVYPKEFVIAALNAGNKVFIVYVVIRE